MVKGVTIQDRVATAILDAAAVLLAGDGEPPSMADVAEAAGVGRATLYRYFPTREALFQALAAVALDSISTLLSAADLDNVPVPEALARVTRACVTVGAQYAVLVSQPKQLSREQVDECVSAPIRRVMQRGHHDGTFRADLSVDELLGLFGGLLHAALHMSRQDGVGVEKASALVTSVLLHGASRASPPPAGAPRGQPEPRDQDSSGPVSH